MSIVLSGTVVVEEDVGRLEVEVEDGRVARVEVVDAERHLAQHAQHVEVLGERLVVLVQQVVHRAGAQLEEDAHPVRLKARAEEANDMHVAQLGQPASSGEVRC